MATKRATYDVASFKALPDSNGDQGRFEAIVSVFGNIDLQGDRVIKGAFQESLAEWRAKGDPIPIVWSHEWGNPHAHIGAADPKDVEETDAGLSVKGRIDLDNPFGAQVFRLMKERRVREFSFAYDIRKERAGKDGANELQKLGIIEAGPTLKGANPATELLTVKSDLEAAAAIPNVPTVTISPSGGDDTAAFQAALESLPSGGRLLFDPGDYKISDNVVVGNTVNGKAVGLKVYGAIDGSFEETERQLSDALKEQFGSDDVWLWVVATYPDRVVYSREANGQPSEYFEVSYTVEGETFTFDTPTPVELTTEVRAKAGRRISRATESELSAAIDGVEKELTRLRGLLSSDSDDEKDEDEADAVGKAIDDDLLFFEAAIAAALQ